GAQDNGSFVQTGTDSKTWKQFFGGDGNTQAYDAVHDIRYSLANNFSFFHRGDDQIKLSRTIGGKDFSGLDDTKVSGRGTTDKDCAGAEGGFNEVPYVLNAVDPSRMLIGREAIYESLIGRPTGDVLLPAIIPGAGTPGNPGSPMTRATALAYGGRSEGKDHPLVAFVGDKSGQLFFPADAGGA